MIREADRRRQEQRRLELNLDGERVRQSAFKGCKAAGFQPHAVSDGASKAEEASGERIQMDWIDITGDGGVAATDIPRDAPEGI